MQRIFATTAQTLLSIGLTYSAFALLVLIGGAV